MFWPAKKKPKGYGAGGAASKVNGVERANSVTEQGAVISPEEKLVWAMLKLAAHDCLLFRRRGDIDKDGRAKLLTANLNGFQDDRQAPQKVLYFWRELAQEWINAVGGKLDAARALNKMLKEPYRGIVNMGKAQSYV